VEKVEQLNQGHAVRLTVQGPADAVVKAASRYPVISLTSYEPSLEDIFLRYYERDGQAQVPSRPSGDLPMNGEEAAGVV
jgi:ABC-2 type transport system ATP-binding protein